MRSRVRNLVLVLPYLLAGAAAAGEPDDTVYRVEGGAAPGRDTVPALDPVWCKEIPAPGQGHRAMQRTMSQVVVDGKLYATARAAQLLCDYPDRPAWREQTGQLVQVWVNEVGLDTAQATASVGARADEARWEKERETLCATYAVDGEASEEDKARSLAHREIFGCGNGSAGPAWASHGASAEVEWFLDRGPEVPELLRAYLVIKRLRDPRALKRDDFGFMSALGAYVVFGLDARRLDAARLEPEIAGLSRYGQVVARETHALARLTAAGWLAHVEALAAKDPVWRSLVLDTPEQAFAAWVDLRATQKAAFDVADAFEEVAFAPSRSAAKGCVAGLREQFARTASLALSSGSLELRDVLERIQGDPVATPLLERRVLCEAAHGDAGIATALYAGTDRLRGHRGPRTAAALAALDQLNDLRADRDRFPLEAKDLPTFARAPFRDLALDRMSRRVIFMDDGRGVVKSVKKVDEGMLVSFRGEAVKETNWDCKPTNRVRRIAPDGTVEYWSDCKNLGVSTVTKTPSPVVIPSDLAAGISAGRFLVWKVDVERAADARKGTPIAVYDGAARKKLLALYGVSL